MDEGSALLHHLERRFNRWLCSVAVGNAVAKDVGNHDDGADAGVLTMCGSEGVALEGLVEQIRKMVEGMNCTSNHHSRPSVCRVPLSLSQMGDDIGDCQFSKYLLIVVRAETFQSKHELNNLLLVYREAKRHSCSVLLLVVMETDDLSVLNSVIRCHPELGILYCTKRIYTVARQRGAHLLQQASPVLNDWLSGVLPDDAGALERLDYPDIFKIVVRDLQQTIPGLEVFVRLTALVVGGVAAVLLTVIALALLSTESQLTMDVRQSRQFLQSVIESRRAGKGEWGWRDTPSALVALQLNDPSWCFSSESSHRSVDQMEIGLLSEISRLTLAPTRRQLTPSALAAYVNALLAVYHNPRSFHGYDLLSTLLQAVENRSFRLQYDNFVYGGYVIAMFNAGLQPNRKHVTRLLARQRQDGSFPYGPEEAVVTVQALSCFEPGHVPRDRLDLTLEYLMRQRLNDHSYGSLLTTSLIVQIVNATKTKKLFVDDDYEDTVEWLIKQSSSDVIRRNVHLAANLLMALTGKSLLSLRELTGNVGFVKGEEVTGKDGFTTYIGGGDDSISPHPPSSLPPPPPSSLVLSRHLASEDFEGATSGGFQEEEQDGKDNSTEQRITSDRTLIEMDIPSTESEAEIVVFETTPGDEPERHLATENEHSQTTPCNQTAKQQGSPDNQMEETHSGNARRWSQNWKDAFLRPSICLEGERR